MSWASVNRLRIRSSWCPFLWTWSMGEQITLGTEDSFENLQVADSLPMIVLPLGTLF
jgi:hypothetical protein